jgi:hypothetical protein
MSTLESGNASSREKFAKTTLYETVFSNPKLSTLSEPSVKFQDAFLSVLVFVISIHCIRFNFLFPTVSSMLYVDSREETIPRRSRVCLRWKVGMRVRERSSRKRHFTKLCLAIRNYQPFKTPRCFLWRVRDPCYGQ